MKAINSYKRASVATSDPMDVLVALYDGVLKHLHAAVAHLEQTRPAEAGAAMTRALAIVNELQASLSHHDDPEFSGQLDAIYTWATAQVMRANLQRDADKMTPVIEIFVELRAAWSDAATSLRSDGFQEAM